MISRSLSALATLAACLVVLALPLLAAAQPRTQEPLAAVFPPWWNSARTLAHAASAGPVAAIGAPFVAVMATADPAHPARLRAAGAWLLLPGRLIPCSPLPPRTPRA